MIPIFILEECWLPYDAVSTVVCNKGQQVQIGPRSPCRENCPSLNWNGGSHFATWVGACLCNNACKECCEDGLQGHRVSSDDPRLPKNCCPPLFSCLRLSLSSVKVQRPVGGGQLIIQRFIFMWVSWKGIMSKFPFNCSWSNKTIGDEGITVDFRFIKVHTSNWSSNSWGSLNSWGSSNTWGSSNSSCWDHRIVGDYRIPVDL